MKMEKTIKETEVDNEFYSGKIKKSGEFDKKGNFINGLITETRNYKRKVCGTEESTIVVKRQVSEGKEAEKLNFSIAKMTFDGIVKETPEAEWPLTPVLGKMSFNGETTKTICEGRFENLTLTDGIIQKSDSSSVETNYVSKATAKPERKIELSNGNSFRGIYSKQDGRIVFINGRFVNKETSTIYDGEFKDNKIYNGVVFKEHEKSKSTFFYEEGKLVRVVDKYANGKVYSGKIDENMKRTEGKTFFPDGVIIDCTDSETYTCSNARLTQETNQSKVIYTGDIKEGRKHGKGKMEVYVLDKTMVDTAGDNYCTFEGEFENDKFVKGKITNNNSDEKVCVVQADVKYETNNICKGTVKLFGKDSCEYIGEFTENLLPNGKCVYKDEEETYEGDFVMGLRHGKGKLTLLSGEVIEGEWENDELKNVTSHE